MPTENITVTPSHQLEVALAFAYLADQSDFAGLSLYTDEPVDDGIFPLGQGGMAAPSRILVFPFASDQLLNFSVQVIGWRSVVRRDNLPQIWMPQVLVEAFVTTGVVQGPDWPNTSPNPLMPSNLDYMASTVTLTGGSLGPTGELWMSVGSPAALVVETRGCKKVQFAFAQQDGRGVCNALWARL